MRGVWLGIAIGCVAAIGCTNTPKREMRQPQVEELTSPPQGTYLDPPDYTKDQPLLVPKNNTPGLNTPGMPGTGGPTGAGGPLGTSATRR
jgi:hypothetical protein